MLGEEIVSDCKVMSRILQVTRKCMHLDPDALYRPLVEFEGRLSMDHHNDTQFLTATWTQGAGLFRASLQANIILAQSADQALDQPSFPRLEIAEEQKSATAFDIDDLACAQVFLPVRCGSARIKPAACQRPSTLSKRVFLLSRRSTAQSRKLTPKMMSQCRSSFRRC